LEKQLNRRRSGAVRVGQFGGFSFAERRPVVFRSQPQMDVAWIVGKANPGLDELLPGAQQPRQGACR
jgi:hypothetical protein